MDIIFWILVFLIYKILDIIIFINRTIDQDLIGANTILIEAIQKFKVDVLSSKTEANEYLGVEKSIEITISKQEDSNHPNIVINESQKKIEPPIDETIQTKKEAIELLPPLDRDIDDYIPDDYQRKEIGELGESLVLRYIENSHKHHNNYDVFHESKVNGNHAGAGYDIKLVVNGQTFLIEVKSTTKGRRSGIIITSNEYATMIASSDNTYVIAKVYDIDLIAKTGKLMWFEGHDIINKHFIDKQVNNRRVSYK